MMRRLLSLLLIVLVTPAMGQSQIPQRDIIAGAIEDYIRPAFHELATQMMALDDAIAALCAAPSTTALDKTRAAFRDAALAHARVEFLHFGPLARDNRQERLLFWPDARGIGLRQVQQVLAAKDPEATDPRKLRQKSVALQGLGALEYVLFGTGTEELAGTGGSYRCAYAEAIGALLTELSTTLDREWADPAAGAAADTMLNPKPESPDYRSLLEAENRIAAALIDGTEMIRDTRITPVLAPTSPAPRPKAALFWRSGMSVPTLSANFSGMGDFYDAARFAEALGPSNDWMSKSIAFEFRTAAQAAASIVDPITVAVENPDELKALRQMVFVTQSLDTLLNDNLAPALGLTIGFSQLDGD